MLLKNAQGVALSGAGPIAMQAYDAAVSGYNRMHGDPVALLDQAITQSPAFVMAHVLKGYLHIVGTDPSAVAVAGASLHEAAKLSATAHEQGHIAALERFIDGEWRAAVRILEDLAAEEPRDLVAIQTGHLMDLVIGDSRMLRDRPARALAAWSEDIPGYSALLGMHAFGLEQTFDYAAAELEGRRALELEPTDAWARHAVAHVLEMRVRPREGLQLMLTEPDAWAKDNFLAVHNWWHTALFHLELGETDQVLALYDGPIAGAPTYLAFDMVDASAMLWRLSLRGVDVGDRWKALAEAWRTCAADSIFAFNDFHAMMAFAAAGDEAGVLMVEAAQARALGGRDDNAETVKRVGHDLTAGIKAFAQGDYRGALTVLRPVRNLANRFGGSHAQRDVIDLTMIEAALREGDVAMASALVAERQAVRPKSESVRELLGRIPLSAPEAV
jgi:hypothetical protein